MRKHMRETAENRITFLIDRGKVHWLSLLLLNQTTPNAPLWLAARCCIKNHALALTDFTSKWIKVSFFLLLWYCFFVSVFTPGHTLASSALPEYLCRWHTCKLTLIHEVKLLSEDLAEKMLAPNFLQCHLERVGMYFFNVLCTPVEQKDSY